MIGLYVWGTFDRITAYVDQFRRRSAPKILLFQLLNSHVIVTQPLMPHGSEQNRKNQKVDNLTNKRSTADVWIRIRIDYSLG